MKNIINAITTAIYMNLVEKNQIKFDTRITETQRPMCLNYKTIRAILGYEDKEFFNRFDGSGTFRDVVKYTINGNESMISISAIPVTSSGINETTKRAKNESGVEFQVYASYLIGEGFYTIIENVASASYASNAAYIATQTKNPISILLETKKTIVTCTEPKPEPKPEPKTEPKPEPKKVRVKKVKVAEPEEIQADVKTIGKFLNLKKGQKPLEVDMMKTRESNFVKEHKSKTGKTWRTWVLDKKYSEVLTATEFKGEAGFKLVRVKNASGRTMARLYVKE